MLEILQYVTSGFWVFWGCVIFTFTAVGVFGWAVNAALLGIRGINCGSVEVFSVTTKGKE